MLAPHAVAFVELPTVAEPVDDQTLLWLTAKQALAYFLPEHTHNRGLVRDSAAPDSPCSIAAIGFAAAAFVAGESLGLVDRDEALRRCLEMAEAVAALPMADTRESAPDAAGYRGYYYHFLIADGPDRGRREWKSELSSIDTALLVAGLMVAAGHFIEETESADRLRALVHRIVDGVEWPFLLRQSGRIGHGWRPEAVGKRKVRHDRQGFIVHEWDGYNEGLLLYLLALASETHPVPDESYDAWCETYPRDWQSVHGIEHLHCPPLFVHQFPHAFLDFRDISDRFLRDRGIGYVENSRRAALAQIEYVKQNPHGFEGYGPTTWGISASNGPGLHQRPQLIRDGRKMRFHGYVERGLAPPTGVIDDGTLAPWAAAACLPFLPEATVDAIRAHREVALCRPDWLGFMGSYNLTYQSRTCPHGWADEHDLAIEQAPIVMMIANARNGSVWNATKRFPGIRRGLRAAGMRGGWIGD